VLQDAKVIPVDTHLPANLVLVALLQNDRPQDAAVALGKFVDNLLDQFTRVAAHHLMQRIGTRIGRFRGGILVVDCRQPLPPAMKLVANVIAD
jgi:hypothetical protein